MTENMRRRSGRIADNLFRLLPWQADAVDFLNDVSLLLYARMAGQSDFLVLLKSAERQSLTEEILGTHAELRKWGGEFGRAIQKIKKDQWEELISCLETLPSGGQLQEPAAEIFDCLLQTMYEKRSIASFITPQSLADMMAGMLEPQPGELVMDPVCGSGRLLVSAAKRCRDCVYIGNDMDQKTGTTAFFHLFFHGITDADIYWKDFLKEQKEGYSDLILANPPYHDDICRTIHFVERIMEALKPGGRCGILVPEGFLTNVMNHEVMQMRRSLLRDNSLEGVVSLPRKIYKPYTISKSSLILLKKESASSQHRTFFSCVEEYEGPENDFTDRAYEQSMKEIEKAWKLWNRGTYNSGAADAVFWTASRKDIEEKNCIFGADHYRRLEPVYEKPKQENLWKRIFEKQEALEESVACYFEEDFEI